MTALIKDYVGRSPNRRPAAGSANNFDSRHTVSVITVAFNSAKTIERTIDSILTQTYPHVEYIVIDGASSDGTTDLIRRRSKDIDLWLSEPDHGISDAFNKGIAMATGEYISIVNSDDWLEPTHLATAMTALANTRADFVYGDLMLHPPNGQPAYLLIGETNYARRLPHAMPQINHPTIVCRRVVYEKYGLFDVGLFTAMDYVWLLRVHKEGVIGSTSPAWSVICLWMEHPIATIYAALRRFATCLSRMAIGGVWRSCDTLCAAPGFKLELRCKSGCPGTYSIGFGTR